jgi:hypothetical protein
VAGRDLSITGDSVTITPGHDKRVSDEKFEQKTSGLTLGCPVWWVKPSIMRWQRHRHRKKRAMVVLQRSSHQSRAFRHAGQAVAGGLNPWAAQLIKQQTTDAAGNVDVAANAMAHAVWGAVSAQMSGGNAAAGAAGAFSGELATRYIAEKY